MKIFVYHTPELVPTQSLPDCAVVIDVLRATSTIATALHNGAAGIRAFADLEELQQTAAPFEYTPERVTGKRILMSTTNGTRALQAVQKTTVVITAAFINLGVVRNFLKQEEFQTVWLVGSGWEGSYSLEDTGCAGAVAWELGEPGNDETVAACALYGQWQGDLLGLLKQASHGQRLLGLGCLEDLKYCADAGRLNVLPRQNDEGYLVGTYL